jgi:hypothetical protein
LCEIRFILALFETTVWLLRRKEIHTEANVDFILFVYSFKALAVGGNTLLFVYDSGENVKLGKNLSGSYLIVWSPRKLELSPNRLLGLI